MKDYKEEKIEVLPKKDDYGYKTYQLKGKDNQLYNIKIFLKDKSIIFNAKIVGDFTDINYSKQLKLEEFYNLNNFFRQYLSIEELFILLFKNFKEKEMFIIQTKNIIKLSFYVLSRNIKKEVSIILSPENMEIENILYKLCEKIKEIEKIIKMKEEKKKMKDNTKIFKFMKTKVFLIVIFFFFLIINLALIIYVLNIKIDYNYLRNKINEITINNNALKFLIKEVNKKNNMMNEKNKNDINNEINDIKNNILINIKDIKNEVYEITEKMEEFEINKTKIEYNKIIDNRNINKKYIKTISYYIDNNIAFNLINKGIIKNKNTKIKNYELIFRASRDGYKAEDFHKKCDWKGNTVTFIVTKSGRIFGGFTDVSWDSESDAKEGSNGFIFSLDNREIYYNINLKFNIRCIKDYGPIFGNFDLSISNNSNNNKSYINPYAYDIHDKNILLEENNYFYVQDYEVYKVELENEKFRKK